MKIILADYNDQFDIDDGLNAQIYINYGADFRSVVNHIEAVYRDKCREIGTDYSESHVFDEEQSVKWNRAEVLRQNQEKKAARNAAAILRVNSNLIMHKAVQKYIERSLSYCRKDNQTYSLTEKQVEHIIQYLRSPYDYEWYSGLDMLIALLVDLDVKF